MTKAMYGRVDVEKESLLRHGRLAPGHWNKKLRDHHLNHTLEAEGTRKKGEAVNSQS